MKKIFAQLCLVLYILFVFVASGMASELYYIKNSNKSSMLPNVQNAFKAEGYTLKKEDPIYGVKGYTNAVVILQQTGLDLYYFYDSVDDTNLNKTILKKFKNSGSSYKKVTDTALLTSFNKTSTLLKKSVDNANKQYSFSDEDFSAEKVKTTKQTQTSTEDVLKGHIAKIPVGTTMNAYIQSSINTANAKKGDEVIAILTKNWDYNGTTIAQQGSVLTGSVTKANAAGMAYKNGYVQFKFHTLTDVNGKVYNISTEEIEFKVDSTGKMQSAATKAVAGAAIGALAGLLIGAMSDSHSYGTSIAISSGAGAVLGLGSAALEQGMDAEIPVYTEMVIKLTAPLNVVVAN